MSVFCGRHAGILCLLLFNCYLIMIGTFKFEEDLNPVVPDPNNVHCMIHNADDICLYGVSDKINKTSEEEDLLCAGPKNKLTCNNTIRSVMMTGCDGRLGNVMMAYATLYYFYKRLGYNAVLTEYQAKTINTMFNNTGVIKQGKINESMSPTGVATLDEYSDYSYPTIFDHHDEYKYNKLLDVGIYPTPFYLFKEIWQDLKKQFQFKKEILDSARSALDLSTETHRVSYPGAEFIYIAVHARRGDYVNNPNHVPEFFTDDMIAVEFFTSCMDSFREKIDSTEKKTIFVMLSDDIDWFRKYFGEIPDLAFPGPHYPLKEELMAGRDMAIFQLCHHVIRTLGTYSIWGGLWSEGTVLSPYTGKILIDEHIVTALASSDWIQVDINPLLQKYNS